MKFVVYRIRNTKSDVVYIGSTGRFEKRRDRHLIDLRNGQHHSTGLQKDFAELGPESFVFEIVAQFDELLSARAHESKLIATCSSGRYNRSLDASGGKLIPEARANQIRNTKATWNKPEMVEYARERAKKQFSDPEARAEASRKQKEFVRNNPERARQINVKGGIASRIGERSAKAVVRDDGLEFVSAAEAGRSLYPDKKDARASIKQALRKCVRAYGHWWYYKE